MDSRQYNLPFEPENSPHGRNSRSDFVGTDNPRHLRAIDALSKGPCKREDLDRIAGASNSPELVADLRRRGLRVPCKMVAGVDRDGVSVKYGVYSFDDDDFQKLRAWVIATAGKE
jgi:hypothetical protein